jgi:hypothetical protein
VAADAMSIPEVCRDGAWLHRPGDDRELEHLLRKCLAGGPEVQALIERGTAVERSYSWRRTAELTFACYVKAIESAKAGTSPRPPLDPGIRECLAVAARYKFNDLDRELAAWQQRCLNAEAQLHTVSVHAGKLEARLREMGQQPAPPPPAPPPVPTSTDPALAKRPRWSLKRRIKKIRDGLRRRTNPEGT